MQFQIEKSAQQLARIRTPATTGAVKRTDIEDAELVLARLERWKTAVGHAAAVDEKLQKEQIQQLDLAVNGLSRNLDLTRMNLESLMIKVPIGGHLTLLDAHLGESKGPGQRLGQVDQVESSKVVALVDEHYLDRVSVGQSASAEVGSEQHVMELVKVYPEVKERQFKVDLAFAGATPGSVRRGQTLQLRLAKVVLADEPTGNLDSKSGEVVMALLETLNRRGVTIVMVTHSPVFAARVQRTIEMLDGRIVESRCQQRGSIASLAAKEGCPAQCRVEVCQEFLANHHSRSQPGVLIARRACRAASLD